MRVAPTVTLTEQQREQTEANVRGRSLPARLVERSRIVLLAAAGARDSDIAATLNITPHKVARWRLRFLELGLPGLEKDAARPGRPVLISPAKIQEVVTKTTQELPPNATHWSTRTMASAAGLSEASVRRIWHAHGLKPHLLEGFKLGNNPVSRKSWKISSGCT